MSRSTYSTLHKPMELLPASLLPYRQRWQPLVRALPGHTYLIVMRLECATPSVTLQRVVAALRQQGQRVYLLPVREGEEGAQDGLRRPCAFRSNRD